MQNIVGCGIFNTIIVELMNVVLQIWIPNFQILSDMWKIKKSSVSGRGIKRDHKGVNPPWPWWPHLDKSLTVEFIQISAHGKSVRSCAAHVCTLNLEGHKVAAFQEKENVQASIKNMDGYIFLHPKVCTPIQNRVLLSQEFATNLI